MGRAIGANGRPLNLFTLGYDQFQLCNVIALFGTSRSVNLAQE